MSEDTKLDLAAIKARCAAATREPWKASGGRGAASVRSEWASCAIYINARQNGETPECVNRWHRDAEFIAAARTDVPALVAEVERLRSDLAECYRITGADPDGDDDAMLARKAVAAVKRLREESDTEAETADKRIAELEIGVREIAIMHQDDRPGIGEPSGDFDWRLRSEAQERVARALLAKGGAA